MAYESFFRRYGPAGDLCRMAALADRADRELGSQFMGPEMPLL